MTLTTLERPIVRGIELPAPEAVPPAGRGHRGNGVPEELEHGTPRSPRVAAFGHLLLTLVALFSVLPLAWMIVTGFRAPDDLFTAGFLPTKLSAANYSAALQQIPVGTLLWHTVLVSVGVAVGQLLLALLAAYSFARFRFRGQGVLFLVFVGSWLVPFQVTMLPNYVLLYHLGLLNSLVGIIVPQLSSAFAILLLRQHLRAFPADLLEASRLEGQSAWAALWKVVVPNMGPALAALGILLFVSAWNEYFWPLIVYRNPNSVIQLGIQGFLNSVAVNYGALMAASSLATIPIFVIYALLQRRLVNAFVRSGLR
jgi:ABC-type glycerol-3-phosphate transport system permease component